MRVQAMSIEAMKQALEALEIAEKHMAYVEFTEAITSLRQAITTEESSATQEPIAHIRVVDGMLGQVRRGKGMAALPNGDYSAYTHPQPKAEQQPVFKFQMQLKDGWGGQYPRAQVIGNPDIESLFQKIGDIVTFYAAQPKAEQEPKREWVGLNASEYAAFYNQFAKYQEENADISGWFEFAEAIEAKLKEKNT